MLGSYSSSWYEPRLSIKFYISYLQVSYLQVCQYVTRSMYPGLTEQLQVRKLNTWCHLCSLVGVMQVSMMSSLIREENGPVPLESNALKMAEVEINHMSNSSN